MEFLQEECLEFYRKGLWMPKPYDLVEDISGLHLSSSIGMIPQRTITPCIIVDYSFYGVNNQTMKMALTRKHVIWESK
jgi:hypothetical protein